MIKTLLILVINVHLVILCYGQNLISNGDFGISGGEYFLYEHWFELTKLLLENNYNPYISTKVPIGERIINQLKELGVKRIQISYDSTDIEIIKKMLKVGNKYLIEMDRTLKNLEANDIKINVKSVITKHNDTIESVKKTIKYLLSFKNCEQISIAPGEFSFYNPFDYKTSLNRFNKIREFVDEFKLQNKDVDINVQAVSSPQDISMSIENKIKQFNARSGCSGNTSMFYILPDGKVTICEQVYWHPFFILGDLTSQSILEMWNSKEAINLYNIKQENIKSESPCSVCKDFEECRRGTGVCWRDAIFAYGKDNYDYPSPNCPFAPKVVKDIYI